MLVDDSDVDLFLHKTFLKKCTWCNSIISYSSALNALNYLTETSAENWPDLILLDIQMPIMNGFDFLSQYCFLEEEKLKKTKIIMVSSSLDFGDIARAKANYYVVDLLAKPLNTDALYEIIKDK